MDERISRKLLKRKNNILGKGFSSGNERKGVGRKGKKYEDSRKYLDDENISDLKLPQQAGFGGQLPEHPALFLQGFLILPELCGEPEKYHKVYYKQDGKGSCQYLLRQCDIMELYKQIWQDNQEKTHSSGTMCPRNIRFIISGREDERVCAAFP